MLVDPQSITVNAVAVSLPRISSGEAKGVYRAADKSEELQVSRVEGSRNRTSVRINFRKIAADPFQPSVNQEYTGSAYAVVDAPRVGYSNTELKHQLKALRDWLTDANIDKVLGGEV